MLLLGWAKDSNELQISLVGVIEKGFCPTGLPVNHRAAGADTTEELGKVAPETRRHTAMSETGARERSEVHIGRCDNGEYHVHLGTSDYV